MLGTPDESIWPGVSQLPDYTSRFPRWDATSLNDNLPTFDDDAKDLISVRLKKAFFVDARIYKYIFFLCF